VSNVVDLKILESIAVYAKLRMEDGDLEEINSVLAMIDEIHGIHLDRDGFSVYTDAAPVMRTECSGGTPPSMPRDDLLRNAPQVEAGCISVPKILGGEGNDS
jgi:Asp-tRNA(Asn)/Glu-tRNA(Gln) amidotransferase C subunit